MHDRTKDVCKVSVTLTPRQQGVSEDRILEGPKSIYVQTPVDGDELIRTLRAKLGDTEDADDSVKYLVVLTDLVPPKDYLPTMPSYFGSVYFEESLSVSKRFFAEELIRLIDKTLGGEETPRKIHGFIRMPKGGKPVTNEMVRKLREEIGV